MTNAPLPCETWLVLETGPGEPAFNMALDEALLLHAQEIARPMMRFYSWTKPAATFGYFQRFSIVTIATDLRPLIRRPTGGGIVPHDGDWTYSMVIPPEHEWYALRAIESYGRLHRWICDSFGMLGFATTLASSSRKPTPGRCFAGHEKHDVLLAGKKIAGAAQRRNKLGLLIQGSVQPPSDVTRRRWQRTMLGSVNSELRTIPVNVMETARRLTPRYESAEYNERQ